MNIIPLSEGNYTVGHDKVFIPFKPSSDELNDRSTGSILVEIQPFLVIANEEVLLLDAGIGVNGSSGLPVLIENLSKHGFTIQDVDKILLSHLHKDHIGGCFIPRQDGKLELAFPDTQHYIYRNEVDFALANPKKSYEVDKIQYLIEHAKIVWLDGPAGNIDDHISYEHSGGHSPEHIVYKINEGQEIAFYGGDEAPQMKQMRMKYVAKYDFDGKKAMALREQYSELARKEHWKMMFYHDIKEPVVQF